MSQPLPLSVHEIESGSLFFSLNLLLGAFNLLPLPPLDGSSVPLLFLPGGAARKYWLALRQPVFAWVGLMAAWKLFALVQPALPSAVLGKKDGRREELCYAAFAEELLWQART